MKYSPRFQLEPTSQQADRLDWTRDVVRQVYNHGLKRLNEIPDSEGTLRQRIRKARDELPTLKDWWNDLTKVYSTVLQNAFKRIRHNKESLRELQANGYDAGELKWKGPREFRSFTYNRKGFELDKKSGPTGYGRLTLKKIAGNTIQIPIRLHRDLPDGDIKQLTVKKANTAEWFATFTVETDAPEKPAVDEIDADDCVGLDLGITSFIHDSDGRSVNRLDLNDDLERLEREQRALSRKQRGSNNWEQQRRCVGEIHQRLTNRKRDYKHKLSHFYTTTYDAVFVENLDVKEMLEDDGNARNTHHVGWRNFIQILKHHGNKNGCHVVEVDPDGTTKECHECGVAVEKPLWVREHSCPSCGFTADRDLNAAYNVLDRGLNELGVVHSEATTPVETATAADTTSVSASRVVEAGSRALKEPATAGE